MSRAFKIFAIVIGLIAAMAEAPESHAIFPNSITASTTVGYVVPVGSTFGVSLRVECIAPTLCVGYQYELNYNPAVVSLSGESITSPSPAGLTLCPNPTVLPPPWAGMYGGCLRPDNTAQSVNADMTIVTFACNAYGSAALSLVPYNATAAPFGARTLDGTGAAIATTLRSINVLCSCPVTDLASDTDFDGVGNACEASFHTNLNLANTDNGTNQQPDGAELLRGTNAVSDGTDDVANDDADGDGCSDAKEVGPNWATGGQRDPTSPWDFPDVPLPALTVSDQSGTRNHAVSIADITGGILKYVGTSALTPSVQNVNGASYGSDWNGNGVPDGREYDFSNSLDPARSWRTGRPNGSVSIADQIAVLNAIGSAC